MNKIEKVNERIIQGKIWYIIFFMFYDLIQEDFGRGKEMYKY